VAREERLAARFKRSSVLLARQRLFTRIVCAEAPGV